MTRTGRLANKRALVTAAGQGIGRAPALAMAAEGAEVYATDIDGDSLAGLSGENGITTFILNMSSVASSVIGAPNRFVYGVTKAAVIGLTKSIASDYVKSGVRCNAICPGTVMSPSLQDRLAATGDYDKAEEAFIARQPMGRFGQVEEIAALVVYLASAESGFVTGQAINIDGGWTG